MNRITPALLIVAVVAVMSGCQPALDTNRNNAIATASPAKETYDAAAIESEIIKLEREWADANKTHNAEAVKRLVADDAVQVDEMTAHLKRHHGEGENEADPEPLRHVGEFGIGSAVGCCQFRFSRHTAGARSDLPNLRVHRTGVDRARRQFLGGRHMLGEIPQRIGGELGPAAVRTAATMT